MRYVPPTRTEKIIAVIIGGAMAFYFGVAIGAYIYGPVYL